MLKSVVKIFAMLPMIYAHSDSLENDPTKESWRERSFDPFEVFGNLPNQSALTQIKIDKTLDL